MRPPTDAGGHARVPPDLPAAPDDATAEQVRVTLAGGGPGPDPDAAFTAFVREASGELGRVAWYLTGDDARAEDLLATTLLRTYLHWSRAAAAEAGPMAYARRVMANARTDTWRRLRRERLVEPAALPDAAVPSPAEAHAERDRLARALATLTPRQRRIVVLRHLVGLPVADVAADLGVSTGTVKSVASRGLAHLRTVLADGDTPAVGPRPGPTGRTS